MRSVLERNLLPGEDRPDGIIECRPGSLRTREGCRFAIHYDVRVLDRSTGGMTTHMVSGVSYPAGKTREVWEALRTEQPSASVDPFLPYAYIPGLDMLVQVFPHDHQLPSLAKLIGEPPGAIESALIADFGPGDWRVDSESTELVRYRVGLRATVRLVRRATNPTSGELVERVYYAKVYRDGPTANRAFTMLRHVASAAENGDVRFSVPSPIAYVEALDTVIQTHVPGVPLLRLLRRDRSALRAVRAAGRAVANLHSLDLDPAIAEARQAPRSLQHRLDRLDRACGLIGELRPDLVPELTAIVGAIKARLAHHSVAPAHGDLKPDHVLLNGDKVALIDFDDLRVSDPMLDVANMEAHLARLQPELPPDTEDAQSFARAFVASYFEHAHQATPGRLAAFRAMARIGEYARLKRARAHPTLSGIEDVVRSSSKALEIEG